MCVSGVVSVAGADAIFLTKLACGCEVRDQICLAMAHRAGMYIGEDNVVSGLSERVVMALVFVCLTCCMSLFPVVDACFCVSACRSSRFATEAT